MNRRVKLAPAIAACGLLGVVAFTGCGSDAAADANPIPKTTTSSEPTPTTPATPREKAIADARAVVEQFNEVDAQTKDPNAGLPLIDQYLVGDYLKAIQANLNEQIQEGIIWTGDPKVVYLRQAGKVKLADGAPKNGNWNGPEVVFQECEDWSTLVPMKNGKPDDYSWKDNPFFHSTIHVYGFGQGDNMEWKIGLVTDAEQGPACPA